MVAVPGDARVVFLQPGRVASVAVPGCILLGVRLTGFLSFVDPVCCSLSLLPAACRLFVLGLWPRLPVGVAPVRPDRPDVVNGCVVCEEAKNAARGR
ncbi:hypothetical protein NDU88_003665 [Pleurodeles waltl]|uniref:Uncharacterized protein n=1 Tax=Pleurodeles waltl TaxID=8319 RepID=A0AAV7UEX2_PLEWA|nr:hypothetical protein NDU88_003665 [Pleurodeles waltl]